jgi:hypothetical protein
MLQSFTGTLKPQHGAELLPFYDVLMMDDSRAPLV